MEISKAEKSDIPEILAIKKLRSRLRYAGGSSPARFFCGRIGQKIGSHGYLLFGNKEV